MYVNDSSRNQFTPQGGGSLSVIIEKHEYPTVRVGNLVWLAENLRMSAPDAVGYNDGQVNEYGLYYQPDGDFLSIAQRIPEGWRVATRDDWRNLFEECGGTFERFIDDCFDERYSNASNNKGLGLLSGGYRGANSRWYLDDEFWLYWSSTVKSGGYYYDIYGSSNGNVIRMSNSTESTFPNDSTNGASTYRCNVRLVKDAE